MAVTNETFLMVIGYHLENTFHNLAFTFDMEQDHRSMQTLVRVKAWKANVQQRFDMTFRIEPNINVMDFKLPDEVMATLMLLN